ncbi:MAG: DUF1648 domain-containing protein [Candidatus Micrarchaeota archaeon]|nr:DUF1648 domain-containing protein [Candidatus Micrarchaeota archaeon]
MRNVQIAILAIIVVSFALGAYVYPGMPGRMASHWNAGGEVDGYMPKFWGVFLMPIISAGLAALMLALPLIDPLRANIEKFRDHYENFIVLMLAFMLYVYVLTLLWNFGIKYNLPALLAPAFGILFYYVGVLMGHAKKNWFIGIRTPWTMSSEKVWDRTHAQGAKLYKAVGVISVLGALAGSYAIFFVIIPVIAVSVWLFVYSYLEYGEEKRTGRGKNR